MIDNQCFSFAGNFIPELEFPQWSSSNLNKLFPSFSSNLKTNNFISYEHNKDFDKFKNCGLIQTEQLLGIFKVKQLHQ